MKEKNRFPFCGERNYIVLGSWLFVLLVLFPIVHELAKRDIIYLHPVAVYLMPYFSICILLMIATIELEMVVRLYLFSNIYLTEKGVYQKNFSKQIKSIDWSEAKEVGIGKNPTGYYKNHMIYISKKSLAEHEVNQIYKLAKDKDVIMFLYSKRGMESLLRFYSGRITNEYLLMRRVKRKIPASKEFGEKPKELADSYNFKKFRLSETKKQRIFLFAVIPALAAFMGIFAVLSNTAPIFMKHFGDGLKAVNIILIVWLLPFFYLLFIFGKIPLWAAVSEKGIGYKALFKTGYLARWEDIKTARILTDEKSNKTILISVKAEPIFEYADPLLSGKEDIFFVDYSQNVLREIQKYISIG